MICQSLHDETGIFALHTNTMETPNIEEPNSKNKCSSDQSFR